ncbi:uncharacterized protein LOC118122912 [Hippoglossus stenolepis]|uniref:uncharacterized protein LOC118122912 n=1 Tax=Hippoglossus stenolepis TaxID=195615 RepID=UPI00159C6CAD|nr:uncharacterized protein LOC118122912 [Hippoglossus stenolepis]
MTSSENEPRSISTEQNCLSLESQQLLERKKQLCVIQELRNHVEFGKTESKEVASTQQEIDSIDDKLRQLSEGKAELQNGHDTILSANHKNNYVKKVSFNTTSQKTAPLESNSTTDIFYIMAPPSTPAPKVILETEDLPAYPCRTQCPECRQFIMTETFKSVSSMTWMVCLMTAMIGCVAGCCFIPFCLDTFKSTTHKCPKCRSSIRTIKKF